MTQEETRLIEMLRRVLKGLMLGTEYMPGQYEIADLLDDVRDSIDKRDRNHVEQALQFCREFDLRNARTDLELAESRVAAYEGTSQAYAKLAADLGEISDDLRKDKT